MGQTLGYRIARGALRGLLRLLCRLHVEGVEHVPLQGAVLLVSNHLHISDSVVLGVTLPRRATVFAARKWKHHKLVGPLLRYAGNAIYVYRGEVDRQALRQALAALKEGRVLAIAPEGTRSRTGGLQEGKEGTAFLALRADVPLVPVVAYGQERLFSSLARGRRADVHVVYGPPFRLKRAPGRAGKDELQVCTQLIMRRLADMLPLPYQGVYGEAHGDHTTTLRTAPVAAQSDR
jgi:1-acyl-sn-glycerol-3-phosphate acyltransferase